LNLYHSSDSVYFHEDLSQRLRRLREGAGAPPCTPPREGAFKDTDTVGLVKCRGFPTAWPPSFEILPSPNVSMCHCFFSTGYIHGSVHIYTYLESINDTMSFVPFWCAIVLSVVHSAIWLQ